jgi:dipeptidyl-peptidase-4
MLSARLAVVIPFAFLALGASLPTPARAEKPTLESLFLKRRWTSPSFSVLKWLPGGSGLLYIDADPDGEGDAILRFDIASQATARVLRVPPAEASRHWIVFPDLSAFLTTDLLESRGAKAGGELRRVDAVTGEITVLVPASEEADVAQLSPDGKRLGYVSRGNLWMVELASLERRQLTFDGGGAGSGSISNGGFSWVYEEEFGIINGWTWSPDSSRIAFWRSDESRVPEYPLIDYSPVHPVTKLMRYPKAGDPNPSVRLGVVSATGGETLWLDTGSDPEAYFPRMQWLPSGRGVAYQRLNRAQNRLELIFARVDEPSQQVVLVEANPKAWVEVGDQLAFLGQDDHQFIWGSERDGFAHLYYYHLRVPGLPPRQLTRGRWEVTGLLAADFARDRVYFSGNRESSIESHVYALSLRTGRVARISPEPGVHSADFSPEGGVWIDTFSSSTLSPRAVLRDGQGEPIKTLASKDLTQLERIAPEHTTFTTADGLVLNAQITYPAGFDPTRKYPVILYVYGGPGVQIIYNSWPSARELFHSLLAEDGYLVVSLDNRGTGGLGRDFRNLIYRDLGTGPSDDQIAYVDFLGKLPWVDAERVGMWGWSFGGYLTAQTLCRGGQRFRAGISVAPVTDWAYYDSVYAERYMSTPAENPEGYARSAPEKNADGLSARLMLIHGTGDDNVHFQNSTNLVDALLAAGKEFDMAYYPNRLHGIRSGPNDQFDLYRRMKDFWDTRLKR